MLRLITGHEREAGSQLWLLWAYVCEVPPTDECPEVAGRGACELSLGPCEQVHFYSELMDLRYTLNF